MTNIVEVPFHKGSWINKNLIAGIFIDDLIPAYAPTATKIRMLIRMTGVEDLLVFSFNSTSDRDLALKCLVN